uniref:VWFD domain-containing protein n=1 Tax=Mola mola TaxID=94237 RepID=A0A3Q3VRF5_MOLML
NHNKHFCSTWGKYHIKTFDGGFFRLPNTCKYDFAYKCVGYMDFIVQLQWQEVDGTPTLKEATLVLNGVILRLANTSITVNNQSVTLPYSKDSILVERIASYVKVEAKLGLVATWNEKDSLRVELDAKFKNQTCGLCGDFNGVDDELIRSEIQSSSTQTCENQTDFCQKLLSGPAFVSCQDLIDTEYFIKACMEDTCNSSRDTSLTCSTVSEYSHLCAHTGGNPQKWRTKELCEQTCPNNLVYQECSNPCTDTCSNPQRSQVCDDHCIDGCFCPAGTVFDDIQQTGCVTVDECYCISNGMLYRPGESYSRQCEKCTCMRGQWQCKDLGCPGICSILGGSHISTYDDKTYTFHGRCSYVLSEEISLNFSILGDLANCEKSAISTCLNAVTLVLPNKWVKFEYIKVFLPIK